MKLEEYKKDIEIDLKEVRRCKIDILVLQRDNEKICQKNNIEIESLNRIIEVNLKGAEEVLKNSGERKIETSTGWCSFRVMPDKWFYDDIEIIAWCKKEGVSYYKTVEVVKKAELKKDVLSGVFKREEVHGIEITPQDPKFNYKINGGI